MTTTGCSAAATRPFVGFEGGASQAALLLIGQKFARRHIGLVA